MSPEKMLDASRSCDKCAREFGERRPAHNYQQPDTMLHDRVAFVRLIANMAIMSQRDPTTPADFPQPHFVGCVRWKMIEMLLDDEPSRPENIRETLTQIAVGEIDKAQAARS